MKSKYVLFIAVIILLITSIAYADPVNVQKQKTTVPDKITNEKNLLDVQNYLVISSESNASEQPSSIPVVIILKNQPLDKTSREVKQKYSGQIEGRRSEITSILNSAQNKLSPRTLDTRRKEAFEKEVRRKSAATAQQEIVNILNSADKRKIENLKKELDAESDSLRKDIIEKQEEITRPEREDIKELLNSCQAIITGESAVINSVFARIPPSCLDSLRESKLVAAVYEDKALPVDLDVSVPSILPVQFYDNGYAGGIWDVAVVDTGVDFTHPALSEHFRLSEVFHSAGQLDPDYADDPTSTDDLNGHGTHVAGIVASADSTYRGVSYGLDTLINAKNCFNTLDGGGLCQSSDGMEAIDWAISTAGADVISRSIGMCGIGDEDCAMARYLDAVVDSFGIHVVNAAGNDGPDEGTVSGIGYNVISVAATDDQGTTSRDDETIASYSSRGPTSSGRVKPDIAAPGTSIMSAAHDWEDSSDFVSFSGTSMATPHVSAATLLIIDYKGYNWDPKAVKALLLNTADNGGSFSNQNDFGRGYIDLDHAYVHKDDVFESSVSEGGAILYQGNVFPDDKATLVWNRHVTYNGANFPSNYYDLNDLDLYMFDETNNEEISTSLTSVDNVEQVEAPSEYESVVLKVDAWTTDFLHGSDTEDVALATEEGFVPVLGPSFFTVLTIPESATDAGFTIIADIYNIGDLDAHNTEVTLNAPEGLLGGSTDFINSVPDNSSASLSWTATPTSLGTFDGLSVSVNSDSYGELFTGQSDASSIIITDDDASGPTFTNLISPATSKTYNGINVSIDITDESGINSAILHYDYGDDGTEDGTVVMDNAIGDTYTSIIPPAGNSYTNKNVSSYIIATDGDDDREGDTTSAVLETIITLLENEAPSITAFEPVSMIPSVNEGDSLEFNYTASDLDGDNLTTIWLSDSIEQATTEAWTYSPDYTQAGIHTVTVIIYDGIAYASQEWIVTVNDVNQPLSWDPTPENQIIEEESNLRYDVNASDPDGSSIEYLVDDPDFNIDSEGVITWIAPENFAGTRNIQIVASDGTDEIAADIIITVTNINDPPVISAIEPITFLEEGFDDSLDLDNYVADVDNGLAEMIWSFTGNDSIVVSLNEENIVTFSAPLDFVGSEAITFTANDGQDEASMNVEVTVENVNDPLVLEEIGPQTINEDSLFTLQLNSSDVDVGDTAIFYSDNELIGVTEDGLISFTPLQEQVGVITVTFKVTDGQYEDEEEVVFTTQNVNDPPLLEEFTDVEVRESDLITITPVFSDEDGDVPTFNYTTPINSSGQWQTTFNDAGTYVVTVTAADGNGGTDSKEVTITIHNDMDEDGIPDYVDTDDDNDGLEDVNDHLLGGLDDIVTNIPNLNLSINNGTNLTPAFTGIQEVKFFEGNNTFVIFNFDFTTGTLNLGNITINKNEDATTGSLLIKGIELPTGETKTIYIEKLRADSNSICVSDQEISSITEISSGCNLANEIEIDCPGISGSYTCSIEGNKFKISGLQHSGVKEFYIAPPAPAPSDGGGGGGGGGGGSTAKIPAAVQEAPQPTPTIEEIELPAPRESRVPEKIQEIGRAIPALQSTDSLSPQTTPPSAGNFLTGAVIGLIKENPVSGIAGSAILVVMVALLFSLGHTKFVRKEEKAFQKMFQKKHAKFLLYLALAAFVIFIIFSMKAVASSESDEFAACLNEKGVIYYRSSVACSNCPLQENILGDSLSEITVIDCAEKLEQCKEEGLPGVPSWKIGHQFYTGIMRIPLLKSTTGC